MFLSKQVRTFNEVRGEILNGKQVWEWILESLEIDTSVPELASYGAMYFDACNSGTTDLTLLNAGNANTMNMLDSSGNVISEGVIENQTLVRCTYEGPRP